MTNQKSLDKKKTIYKQFLIDMGWDDPKYGWTKEKARVKQLLSQQRQQLISEIKDKTLKLIGSKHSAFEFLEIIENSEKK